MKASLVITTKNRRDELRTALISAVAQIGGLEVIVIDDGSTDGTESMVRSEFPQVFLYRFEESRGYIVRRNEGARIAKGDIIFSIDDDAAFSTTEVVEQTLADFDDQRIGAVAMPFIEPHKENVLMQKAPDQESDWITDRFIGTAHALRRDLFLNLRGYREHLIHQGEEGDYCIRMLDAGYFVKLGTSDPIHHFESPKRNLRRMDYYGARNGILFVWQNVPWRILPFHLAATTYKILSWTFRPARFVRRVCAVIVGTMWGLANISRRRPVSLRSYQLFRKLKNDGPLMMSQFNVLPRGDK